VREGSDEDSDEDDHQQQQYYLEYDDDDDSGWETLCPALENMSVEGGWRRLRSKAAFVPKVMTVKAKVKATVAKAAAPSKPPVEAVDFKKAVANARPESVFLPDSEGRRVLVLGADVAGLCAAADLKARGFDVIVLEKALRVGGSRVHAEQTTALSDALEMQATLQSNAGDGSATDPLISMLVQAGLMSAPTVTIDTANLAPAAGHAADTGNFGTAASSQQQQPPQQQSSQQLDKYQRLQEARTVAGVLQGSLVINKRCGKHGLNLILKTAGSSSSVVVKPDASDKARAALRAALIALHGMEPGSVGDEVDKVLDIPKDAEKEAKVTDAQVIHNVSGVLIDLLRNVATAAASRGTALLVIEPEDWNIKSLMTKIGNAQRLGFTQREGIVAKASV
jgi:hypothetical protein